MKILVLNGPNINMLGIREPALYGTETYQTLLEKLNMWAEQNGCAVDTFQSNHEGALVDRIQEALGVYDAIIINAAAYSHTSIAILDALKAVSLPSVEVHITDTAQREPFRRFSYLSAVCEKTIAGYGLDGYRMAIAYLAETYEKA